MEQGINSKFLVKLKKSPSDYLKLFTEVYGEDVMSRNKSLNGTNVSKMNARN